MFRVEITIYGDRVGGSVIEKLPIFYIDGNLAASEMEAKKVAENIIDPFGILRNGPYYWGIEVVSAIVRL